MYLSLPDSDSASFWSDLLYLPSTTVAGVVSL